MAISTENLMNGLNIEIIEIEPIHQGEDNFSFRDTEWSWEDGEKYGLTCHLEIYAKDDFSFSTYIEDIVVIDEDSKIIEITETQKNILRKQINNSINILTLQA